MPTEALVVRSWRTDCCVPRAAGALAAMLASFAFALPAAAQQQKPGDVTADATLTGFAVLRTDLDNGGDFRFEGVIAAGSVDWQLTEQVSVSLALRYAYEHWDFSTPNALGASAPWTNLQMPRVGANLTYSFTDDLSFFVSPEIAWAYESGASASEGKNYGAVVGFTKIFSQSLMLGLGVGIYRQIDETRVFPFPIVRWQIDDKWQLRNALQAGPAGGAGLEIAYSLNDQWELAAGGAYRAYRFRLRDDGPTPNGIGENTGIPLFARLSRKLGPNGRLDFVAGGIIGGKLEVDNANGDTIRSSDYKTAPLLGVSAMFNF